MSRKIWIIVAVVSLASMIAVIGASALMGGCSKLVETAAGATLPMKCHGTFVATTLVGAIGAVSSLLALTGATKEGRRFVSLCTLTSAVTILLLTSPLGIGLCGNATMHCHQTALVVWIAAGIALGASLVQAIKADRRSTLQPKMKL